MGKPFSVIFLHTIAQTHTISLLSSDFIFFFIVKFHIFQQYNDELIYDVIDSRVALCDSTILIAMMYYFLRLSRSVLKVYIVMLSCDGFGGISAAAAGVLKKMIAKKKC